MSERTDAHRLVGRNAQAVVWEGPEAFALREIPLFPVAEDDLILEVIYCGVDGSELHMYAGELDIFNVRAPLIFGDEIIGRVAAIGERARAERGLEVGDRITVEARWPCADGCRNCDRGQYFTCVHNTDMQGYGSIRLSQEPGLWGGYSSHVYVPGRALTYKVPEKLSDRTALFACSVLANGLRWSRLSGAAPGKTAVVIGPGPQGLAAAMSAANLGATVVLVGLERDAARLGAAAALGIQHTVAIPAGETPVETAARIREILGEVDIVIDTAGFAPAKQLAYEVVSALGTVTNVAVATPIEQPLNYQNVLMKEITILNPISHPHSIDQSFEFAQELLDRGIDVGDLITHEFSLKDAAQAIAVAGNKTAESPIKVILNPAL